MLSALARHAAVPGAGGRTPSDVALVALTQGEIERLESGYPRLEDILPLSPLQEGLLFHALYDAAGPDVWGNGDHAPAATGAPAAAPPDQRTPDVVLPAGGEVGPHRLGIGPSEGGVLAPDEQL